MPAVLRIRAPPAQPKGGLITSRSAERATSDRPRVPQDATHPDNRRRPAHKGNKALAVSVSHQKDHTMLCDRHPDCPQPGDIAQLTRGNSIGADPTDSFVIVEDFPPTGRHLVLNLPVDHPGRADWAAAVPLADIATLTRLEPAGSRTWTPAPDPDEIQ
jgi:hypothetical protein